MFVNQHTLPVDQALFTVYVTDALVGTDRNDAFIEEINVIADYNSSVFDVVAAVGGEFAMNYDAGEDLRIIGVINQTNGYLLADVFDTGDLRYVQ